MQLFQYFPLFSLHLNASQVSYCNRTKMFYYGNIPDFFFKKVEKYALCAGVQTMVWYFHLVKCYQFKCDHVQKNVLISQACVHISPVEQLWKFQLGTPMTVHESPSQSAPTQIINLGSAAPWWGCCRNTWNPQLSIERWGCFPRVYWILSL